MADYRGDRVKKLRELKGMSQDELANAIGVSRLSIGNYERGVRKPDVDVLNKLADTFLVSTDYMLGRTDAINPENQSLVSDLGLSEDAIENIKECNRACWNVDTFISSRFFKPLIKHATAFWWLDNVNFMNDQNNSLGISFHESIDRKTRERLIVNDIYDIVSMILKR